MPEKVYHFNLTEQDVAEIFTFTLSDELLASLQEQKEMQDAPDNETPMDMYGKVL